MIVSLRCDCAFFLEKLEIIMCRLWRPECVARHQAQKTNSKAAKPYNHTNNPLSSKTQAAPKRPPSKPNQQTSDTLTQATSAHIRSSSLKSHKTVTKTPDINQSVSQSVNQSGQPSFSIIIIQNPPKINLNITQKHYNISKPASIPQSPHDKPQKNSPHPHPAQRRCHTISQHTTKKLSPCSRPAGRLSVRPSLHSSHKKRAPRPKHPGTLPKPNNIISHSATSSAPSPTDPHAPSPSTYSPSLHSAPVQSLERFPG